MTIATLHLVRLHPSITPSNFLSLLHKHSSVPPLLTSLTHHWVARPQTTHTSAINQPWDVLLVLFPPPSASTAPIPDPLTPHIAATYSLNLAIPSKLIAAYPATNANLRGPLTRLRYTGTYDRARLAQLSAGAGLDAATSQNLECSPELLAFARGMVAQAGTGAGDGLGAGSVTMLNLLRFNAGEPGRESYKRYGQAFSGAHGGGEGVGTRRGGVAKIVGKVIGRVGGVGEGEGEGEVWDEVAIVHYPK